MAKLNSVSASSGVRCKANDPAERYTLKSIPGQFSGVHLLCIEYVGFQVIDPTVDLGFDLAAEYAEARRIHGG